jgi:hypothetical protein
LWHQNNTRGLVGNCMLLAPSKITKKISWLRFYYTECICQKVDQ